jgi:hypothetical protein
MIIYENTKAGFSDDVLKGIIEKKINAAVFKKMGRRTRENEIRSWINSFTSRTVAGRNQRCLIRNRMPSA